MLKENNTFSLEDIRKQPELLTDLLMRYGDVSICLKKKGDMVHVMYIKQHEPELSRMIAEARQEYQVKNDRGYSRDQAFQDLSDAFTEISQQQDADD